MNIHTPSLLRGHRFKTGAPYLHILVYKWFILTKSFFGNGPVDRLSWQPRHGYVHRLRLRSFDNITDRILLETVLFVQDPLCLTRKVSPTTSRKWVVAFVSSSRLLKTAKYSAMTWEINSYCPQNSSPQLLTHVSTAVFLRQLSSREISEWDFSSSPTFSSWKKKKDFTL